LICSLISLPARPHRPQLPQQLWPPHPSCLLQDTRAHLTEKSFCPGPPRRRAQLSDRRATSKGVREPGPPELMGCELQMSHPNWSWCSGATEGVPASFPQVPLLSVVPLTLIAH
jgi:hypothetical protein